MNVKYLLVYSHYLFNDKFAYRLLINSTIWPLPNYITKRMLADQITTMIAVFGLSQFVNRSNVILSLIISILP